MPATTLNNQASRLDLWREQMEAGRAKVTRWASTMPTERPWERDVLPLRDLVADIARDAEQALSGRIKLARDDIGRPEGIAKLDRHNAAELAGRLEADRAVIERAFDDLERRLAEVAAPREPKDAVLALLARQDLEAAVQAGALRDLPQLALSSPAHEYVATSPWMQYQLPRTGGHNYAAAIVDVVAEHARQLDSPRGVAARALHGAGGARRGAGIVISQARKVHSWKLETLR